MKGISGFIPNADGRQHADIAYFEVDLAGFTENTNVIELETADDCEVTRLFVNVIDAFNGGTTDTIQIGDPSDTDRYLAATSIKTTGLKAGTPTGFIHTGVNQKLVITRATSGTAATTGKLRVYVETVAIGKAYHTQG